MASLFSPLLLCWIFMILFPTQAAAEKCYDETGYYTINSTYHDNLNNIFSTLHSSSQNMDNGYGFYNLSYGHAPNRVYAIGQCRGDIKPDDCRSCFNDSTRNLQELCPNQIEAVEWLNNCVLHYSNRSLFGVMNMSPQFCLINPLNVSSYAMKGFFQALGSLFVNLKSRAAAGGSLRKFAAGNVTAPPPGSNTIYALVQCTPDLSQMECSHCLDEAFRNSSTCAAGKKGGHVFLGTSCIFWYEDFPFYDSAAVENFQLPLVPPSQPPSVTSPPLPFTNTSKKRRKSNTLARTIAIVVVSTFVFVGLIIFTCVRFRPWRSVNKNSPTEEIVSVESLQYSYETIKVATDDFSEKNKLGEGGFGVVYKGRLSDGQYVAVKRLSLRSSTQGDLDFKNEVMLVAKLRHRNLVKLLGFCLEGDEKLIVYEFVQNSSLDRFIFDSGKQKDLDWDKRYKIIKGVARGLLYLHADSPSKIIHRDLKASNILLDDKMNPKICDFGIARHFDDDQTHDNTVRVVGTLGYMAPEVFRGHYSVKSDVFSFGVLLLEIISGQKSWSFSQGENSTESLLSYTWKSWKDGNASNIVDTSMRVRSDSEIVRCIQIGLLCVQPNIDDRPTTDNIIRMLGSNSDPIPTPSEPAFSFHSNTQSNFNSRMNQPIRDGELVDASINEASITELFPR